MLKKFALIGAAACLAVSGSVFAQGLYVGADVGGTGLTSSATTSENDNPSFTVPGLGTFAAARNTSGTANFVKNGFSGGIFAGYVFCLGNGFALAPELRGDWANTTTNASTTNTVTNTFTPVAGAATSTTVTDTDSISQKLKGTFNVSVRPGYYVNDNTMIYGRVGYSWSKFTNSLSDTTSGLSASQSKTLGGWAFGGGVEVNLTGQLGLRGDYVYTRYNSQTWGNTTQGGSFTVKPSTNTLRVGLVYTIGNPMQLGA